MQDRVDPGAAFRTSFLDQGLVTFAECAAHYQAFEPNALMEEMRLLLSAPVLAVPFGVSSGRYYALLMALVRCAGLDGSLDDGQRAKLVRICIDIGTFLRGRAAAKRAEAFELAVSLALGTVREGRGRLHIVEAIAAGLAPPAPPAADPLPEPADDLRVLDFAEPPPGFRFRISA